MTDSGDQGQKRWIDDAEEALNRAGDALRAAWDQTRDARMAALETAKDAANRLGEAIDQGIEVAKETWDPSGKQSPVEPESAPTEAANTEEEE